MGPVATKADEYRQLAQECLLAARSVATEEARAALINMARVWLRLAEEQDAPPSPPPPSAADQPQAAMQQQQQPQPRQDDGAD